MEGSVPPPPNCLRSLSLYTRTGRTFNLFTTSVSTADSVLWWASNMLCLFQFVTMYYLNCHIAIGWFRQEKCQKIIKIGHVCSHTTNAWSFVPSFWQSTVLHCIVAWGVDYCTVCSPSLSTVLDSAFILGVSVAKTVLRCWNTLSWSAKLHLLDYLLKDCNPAELLSLECILVPRPVGAILQSLFRTV